LLTQLLLLQADKLVAVAVKHNVLFCTVGYGVFSKNLDMPKGEQQQQQQQQFASDSAAVSAAFLVRNSSSSSSHSSSQNRTCQRVSSGSSSCVPVCHKLCVCLRMLRMFSATVVAVSGQQHQQHLQRLK
jgi:hypothetical protein